MIAVLQNISGSALSPSEFSHGDADVNVVGRASDDLDRNVYCVLGMPIDAIDMDQALRRIDTAVRDNEPFLLTTTNLNFLVISLTNSEFRESILMSDLCAADGMPIIWIAWLMGIPIKRRLAGSDMFEALKITRSAHGTLKTFLFGAKEGVAAIASERLNQSAGGVFCVGSICPGFGSVDELCQDQFINEINSSGADFLVAALGAKKGQLWLHQNHPRLRIPIRAHLGAVINFEAGTVKRAPKAFREWGLEWLWRIKEEPHLFGRYRHDGLVLLGLLATRVLPLAIFAQWLRIQAWRRTLPFAISKINDDGAIRIRMTGYATKDHVPDAISQFRDAIAGEKPIIIDLTRTRALDARFFGLLLVLRKQLLASGRTLQFIGASPGMKRLFRLNGLASLLNG